MWHLNYSMSTDFTFPSGKQLYAPSSMWLVMIPLNIWLDQTWLMGVLTGNWISVGTLFPKEKWIGGKETEPYLSGMYIVTSKGCMCIPIITKKYCKGLFSFLSLLKSYTVFSFTHVYYHLLRDHRRLNDYIKSSLNNCRQI